MMRTLMTWYFLLNKRLFKKPSFLLLLCLVPLLAGGMQLVSRGESRVLHMTVYAEPSADPLGAELAARLAGLDGAVSYQTVSSEEELRSRVQSGEADAGYLIPADLTAAIADYLSGARSGLPYDGHLFCVVVQNNSVQLQLAREQFFSEVFPLLSSALSLDFVSGQPYFADMDEELLASEMEHLYQSLQSDASIFTFVYPDQTSMDTDTGQELNYLTAPLRGLLALLVLLCGLAMGLYLIADQRAGLFGWLTPRLRPVFSWLYLLAGISDAGICAYLGLYLSGTFTSWERELPLMLLLVLSVTGFSFLISQLCKGPAPLGACIPILLLASAVLCPVFLPVQGWEPIKFLLPPYFYLTGLYSGTQQACLFLYALLANLSAFVLFYLRSLRR